MNISFSSFSKLFWLFHMKGFSMGCSCPSQSEKDDLTCFCAPRVVVELLCCSHLIFFLIDRFITFWQLGAQIQWPVRQTCYVKNYFMLPYTTDVFSCSFQVSPHYSSKLNELCCVT